MTISPFSEGKNILDFRSKTHVSNSIDTSALDPFRQGLELTLDKYFQLGFGKIWSGESNGELYVGNLGEFHPPLVPTSNFEEIDKVSPSALVEGGYGSSGFIIDDAVRIGPDEFDGTIEPLTIRSIIAFASTDVPFSAHSVKGNIESGNDSPFAGDDRTVSNFPVADFASKALFFEDNVDTMNGLPTNLGFFPSARASLLPFDDSQMKDGVLIPSGAL